ncbi:MAG: hypothetical protein QXS02_06055 [Candidatus Thermoplasmatota archaeon]
MNYYIPSDEDLIKTLKTIFFSYRIVPSQNKLQKVVKKELTSKDMIPGISGARIRNIVLKNKIADIEIHAYEGDPKRALTRCPVCNESLKRVKNQTIWGGEVTIEFRCLNCGYWTGKKKRIPHRYIFHSRNKG